MKLRKIIYILMLPSILMMSCSVVFTGSITGTLADAEKYEQNESGYGIPDAEVYLYTDGELRDADFDAWSVDAGFTPDEPEDGEPKYFLKTVTDDQGSYTFNGFIWNELFPEYGKSGDRKEVFMLFYHREYGMNKTAYPVYIVSDVTNRIPVYKISRIYNTADIAGSLTDAETGEALRNVNVNIWVPESWSYDSGGQIDTDESSSVKFKWSDQPSYRLVTDTLGEWSQLISYKMMPSSSSNKGTTIVRITYSGGSYIAENAADSRITDGGWDRDGNGSIDPDEDEGYFQSPEIDSGSYNDLGEISLTDELNTAVISGTVVNSSTNDGEANVSVRIWLAEDWSYTSDDPESIAAADSSGVSWRENPEYVLTTNSAGEFSQSISFERKPSISDNRKTTRVRLVFVKDSFLLDTSDAQFTEGGWDRDGNGTIDEDEDDAFFDPSDVIHADIDNVLGTIRIKQTQFRETLSGEVWNNGRTELVNGTEVWLFYNPVDDDGDPATPMRTAAPVQDQMPDYTEVTMSTLVSADTIEKGHFSFTGLEWSDDGYDGNQSKVSFYIYLPDDAERSTGVLSSNGKGTEYLLTAGASNYLSLEETL